MHLLCCMRRTSALVLAIAVAVTLATTQAAAQTSAAAQRIEALRTARPPSFDDVSNGIAQGSNQASAFVQTEPGDGDPATLSTRARIFHDEDHLYVVFVCAEARPRLRARVAPREEIADDDRVAVYLDTFHDRQRSYVFEVNPWGIQRDGILTEGAGMDYSFDTIWRSDARITDEGYVVLMTIPFSSLRFQRDARQTWGVAFGRTVPRLNERVHWPFITLREQGFVPQFAALTGLAGVAPGRQVQLIPYAAADAERIVQGETAEPGQAAGRVGADTKVVIGGNVSVDLTVNPDFSQVESDEPQVSINQRFERYFPERRPFFVENAAFFETPLPLFFSRRIADPDVGARVTGKLGRWALAGLVAHDRSPGTTHLPAIPPAVPFRPVAPGRGAAPGPPFLTTSPTTMTGAVGGVIRAQREIGRDSRIGVFGSQYVVGDATDGLVSVDSRVAFGGRYVATAQAMRTFSEDVLGARTTAGGLRAELRRASRHLTAGVRYTDLDPSFRAPLGFVQRVDIRQIESFATYLWRPAERRLVAFGPTVTALGNWNHDGQRQDRVVGGDLGFHFAGPAQLQIAHYDSQERFESQLFSRRNTAISGYAGGTGRTGWLAISGSFSRGTSINYAPAARLLPFLGAATDASATVNVRPTTRFRSDVTWIYSRLDLLDSSLPGEGAAAAGVVVASRYLRFRNRYQFSRALSLRVILDYDLVESDQALIEEEPYAQWRGDVLATYLVNPWTAIYVGYAGRRGDLTSLTADIGSDLPGAGSVGGRPGGAVPSMAGAVPMLTPTGSGTSAGAWTARQAFVKVSYTIRF